MGENSTDDIQSHSITGTECKAYCIFGEKGHRAVTLYLKKGKK